jgi:hypothetical protein
MAMTGNADWRGRFLHLRSNVCPFGHPISGIVNVKRVSCGLDLTATVGLGRLGGDVESQSETLPAGTRVAPEERLEQLVYGRFRYWLAGIRNPEFEGLPRRSGMHKHGLIRRPVRQRVAEQIGQKLSQAGAIPGSMKRRALRLKWQTNS